MENINLSDIIEDHCANSFALAFRSMFCTEIIPLKNQANILISNYLEKYKDYILPYFDEKALDKYCFTTNALLKKREMIDKKLKGYSKKVYDDEIEALFEEKNHWNTHSYLIREFITWGCFCF